MTEPQVPRDEALKRFDERYDAAEAANRPKATAAGLESGAGAGYTLIGELVGGVLTGLGLGWLLDRFAHTAPFGLIGGLLLGTGVAIFAMVRQATRQADKAEAAPAKISTPGLPGREKD
jgi:ATP synthase protein I